MAVYSKNRHTNVPLTNVAVEYTNNELISNQIFTSEISVAKESDLITVFDEPRRLESSVRANGAEANQVTAGASQESYTLISHALKDIITDRDRNNADSVFSLDIDMTKFLTEIIKLGEEKQAADLFFGSTSWGTTSTRTSSTSWAAANTSVDPVAQVDAICAVIRKKAGVRPNLCILGDETLSVLKSHPKVLERIKYAEKAIITTDLLAALFDIPKVLVGSTSYNTAKEGVTDSFSFLWGPHAWIGYINPVASRRGYSAAYRLRMKNSGKPVRVKKYRDEAREGDFIEVQTFSAVKMIADRAGYLVKNAGLTA